mgnify:CR=1 FL=1
MVAFSSSAGLGAPGASVCSTRCVELLLLGLDDHTVHRDLVISGDLFVATPEDSAQLRAELPDALASEMEGAAQRADRPSRLW